MKRSDRMAGGRWRVYIPPMLNRRLALLLLLAAAGCKEKGADSASPVDSEPEEDRGPDPWEDLEPVALDPFRALVKTPLERATRPSRLLPLGPRPLTAVMDADEGALHVLDHRYHQAGAPSCVDLSFFPDSEVGDRQGGCGQDQVEINRGRLEAGALLAAAAADSEGMRFYAVGRNGLLYSANADVLEGDPFDYLRMDGGVALEDLGGITEGRAVFGDGALWLAHDLSLSRYSRVFFPHFVAWLSITLGMIIIVPGVLFLLQYAFVDAVACMEEEKSPLPRSKGLTRGRRKSLFLLALPWIILSQVLGFFQLWALSQSGMVMAAGDTVATMITFVMFVAFYLIYDERTRKRRAKTAASADADAAVGSPKA